MSLLFKCSLSKTSVISCSIAAVLMIAGCDKTDTTTADAKLATSSATAHAFAVPLATTAIYPITQDPDSAISKEQQSCLFSTDHKQAAEQVQKFLKINLSENDLQTANDFYGSELGLKLAKITEQNINAAMPLKDIAEADMVILDATEEVEVKAFYDSALGQKITAIFTAEGNNEVLQNEVVLPIVSAEFERCKVGFDLPVQQEQAQ